MVDLHLLRRCNDSAGFEFIDFLFVLVQFIKHHLQLLLKAFAEVSDILSHLCPELKYLRPIILNFTSNFYSQVLNLLLGLG